jgi:hypothetical protein
MIERATSHAAGGCSDARAKRVHRFHRQFETVAFVSNHVFGRHAARIKNDLADRMRRDH